MNGRASATRRLALAAWLVVAASVVAWPFAGAGIGRLSAAVAVLPLLLPLAGLVRGSRRALAAAPMALSPALAMAITEVLVNPPARMWAGLTLALCLAAFAAILAALRAGPPA